MLAAQSAPTIALAPASTSSPAPTSFPTPAPYPNKCYKGKDTGSRWTPRMLVYHIVHIRCGRRYNEGRTTVSFMGYFLACENCVLCDSALLHKINSHIFYVPINSPSINTIWIFMLSSVSIKPIYPDIYSYLIFFYYSNNILQ